MIPGRLLKPGDFVDLLDKGPVDEPFAEPQRLTMHSTDAKHALAVEPDRYVLADDEVSEDEPPAPPASKPATDSKRRSKRKD